MTQRLRNTGISMVITLAAVGMAGCAEPVHQSLDTPQTTVSTGAQMALGVVASVRAVSISGTQIGALAGVNAVLGALSQPQLGPPAAGEEIVIRKDDGNTAAIAEPNLTPSIAAGDRVALIASSPAVVIRRN